MVNNIVLGSAIKDTLGSIQRSTRALDQTSERLSTGRRVNSAIDKPTNFFNSSSLLNSANLYSSILDSMAIGVRTIQEAVSGLEAIENILDAAEFKALEARDALEQTSNALDETILADSPVGYFVLDDSDEAIALNQGTLGAGGDGTYTGGVGQSDEILFYGAGGLAATFSGAGQFVDVPNDDSINTSGPYTEKTVELIFNAETVSGRQVLWEEGGNVNNLNIYIDNGVIRVNGRTTNGVGYGPFDISTPIQAGETYHVAFTQDGINDRFTGYLNGVPFGSESMNGTVINSHPNTNGIGAVSDDVYLHDGPVSNITGGLAFHGTISHVALYNTTITSEGMQARYDATSLAVSESFRQDVVKILDQLQGIGEDSHYRGINFLEGDNLEIDLNESRTNKLKIEGSDFTLESLGLDKVLFQRPSQVEESIASIRKAVDKIREYVTSLQTDLSIINTREQFARETINTLKAGSDDLTLADINEEAANQLASQTRLDLSVTALALAGQSQSSILQVIGSGSDLFGG